MRSIFEDKQSEKRMFDIWKEGQERADAAAPGMASFKMEQSQARKQLYNSMHEIYHIYYLYVAVLAHQLHLALPTDSSVVQVLAVQV